MMFFPENEQSEGLGSGADSTAYNLKKLEQVLKCYDIQVPHLYSEDDDKTYMVWLLWGSKEIIA